MPNFPNRCQHLKVNGTQCGSPALRRNRFCYFHKLHHEELVELNLDRAKNTRRRRLSITLPVLEDANSIQVSLMQIMRLIVAGQIDGKTAGLLLYALQTASSNLPRTRFEPLRHEVILDVNAVGQTHLGAAHLWDDDDFADNQEDEDGVEETDPRPNFTPQTASEARNQAELDRWAKVEADRLAILGAKQRAAEDKIERMEEELYAEAEQARLDAQVREYERLHPAIDAPPTAPPAATITPGGSAVLSEKTASPEKKRPAGKESLDEVRRKVTARIKEAVPAIAAAVKAHGGHIKMK